MSSINERFREVRDFLGQSQEEFARKASRTRSEIKNIEYGKTTPKPEVIQAVCAAWNVDRIWLETGVGEMFAMRSRKEELAAIFGDVLSGNPSAKNRFLEAAALLPDDAYPDLVQFILDFAAGLREEDK